MKKQESFNHYDSIAIFLKTANKVSSKSEWNHRRGWDWRCDRPANLLWEQRAPDQPHQGALQGPVQGDRGSGVAWDEESRSKIPEHSCLCRGAPNHKAISRRKCQASHDLKGVSNRRATVFHQHQNGLTEGGETEDVTGQLISCGSNEHQTSLTRVLGKDLHKDDNPGVRDN